MRHKYETVGIVLTRSPAGETNARLTLLTPEFGIVHARAQGVRRTGAKLASSLVTLSESELTLVRGMEQWRIVGAVLKENWFLKIRHAGARARAARVCGLLLRLVAGETRDAGLSQIMHSFFEALTMLPEDMHESAETLAVLRVLATLGLDTGGIPGELSAFTPLALSEVKKKRASYIKRINEGIIASGL